MAKKPSSRALAQVIKGYTELTEEQRREFNALKTEFDGGLSFQKLAVIQSITEAMASTGPLDSKACKCCGR